VSPSPTRGNPLPDPVTAKLEQKELLGAIATVARAGGCHVVPLHRNISNPRNQSDADLLCMKPGMPLTFVKCLLTGDLSGPQAKIKALVEDGGGRYLVARVAQVSDGTVFGWFGDDA
jgi:hypothetical protein